MRFLVRLKNVHGFSPKDRNALTRTAYDLIKDVGADVGNLRVSASAIEFDLLTPSKEVMDRSLAKLVEKVGQALTIRELDIPNPVTNPTDAIRDGISLFNDERYWESHEMLELAWRTATGIERDTLQGIILLAASLVHLQKDEREIALSIVKRASAKLPQEGVLFGIDLTELKLHVNRILSGNQPTFFKIQVDATSK